MRTHSGFCSETDTRNCTVVLGTNCSISNLVPTWIIRSDQNKRKCYKTGIRWILAVAWLSRSVKWAEK